MKILHFVLTLIVVLAASAAGYAQQSLSIVDALPPYDLTATLLRNGHFSVSTRYTGDSKLLVYREDGTGGRPVNYTSHVHFKVDDILFQMPYELNPVTREAPPEHPLSVEELFRDTVEGRPRVNARLYGVMPDGDTMRFVFSMQPVKRPSGGFIRLSTEVHNTTGKARSVGVLMLVDTKIGENDRAPIVTAFGYQNVETEYSGAVAPGMPEFWLALEGSPANPQLTARGNLRASDLIEPDLFLFGNWVDYTALGIPGLASTLWKERTASGEEYTDSAVLLIWDEESMAPGQRTLSASTEIGIVDSLKVSFTPGGSPYDVVLAGSGSCLSYETVEEVPCGDPDYHPYVPDSLQTLYIVTNRGAQELDNVRVVVPQEHPGLEVASTVNAVIPAALGTDVSGVATVTFYAQPRLQAHTYEVPVAVMAGADTVMLDTVCVIVPGLQGEITVEETHFPPLCPGLEEIREVTVSLEGVRCLPITEIQLVGTQPGSNLFSLVPPLPTQIPANGQVTVRIRYAPDNTGVHGNRLAVTVQDSETLIPGTTTLVDLHAEADVTAESRDAEFFFADEDDVLDFGAVCIGDTVDGEWEIANVGGCDVTIDRAVVDQTLPQQFSIGNSNEFPMLIPRGERRNVQIRFSPQQEGDGDAMIIVVGQADPQVDTLRVRGTGDVPRYTVPAGPVDFDTLCPGGAYVRSVDVLNPSACPVRIDSIGTQLQGLTIAPSGAFVIPPLGSVTVQIRASFAAAGDYTGTVTVHSTTAGVQSVDVRAVVRDRALILTPSIDFGDVRLGTSTTATLMLTAAGTADTHAEVVVNSVAVGGINSSEFTLVVPPGTFPRTLAPGTSLQLSLVFTPGELEQRHAALLTTTEAGTVCGTLQPVELQGRGILPVIDVPRRMVDFGRLCVGQTVDTVIAVRNFGNAPLHISHATTEGAADIATVGGDLPATVAEDSTRLIRVRFTPQRLGDIATDLFIHSDGEWFTRPDTVVRLTGTGILCATVWVDTLRLQTGAVASIPVRIRPAVGLQLQTADIVRLMNESGHTTMEVSIAHEPRLFRFRSEPVAGGMAASAPVVSQPGRITLSADGASALQTDDVLAVLRGDVLLGDRFDSELELTVHSFADGYADITERDGLLISEYCAIDRRYVNSSGVLPFVRPQQTPMADGGAVELYLPQATEVRLAVVDAMGRQAAVLIDGAIGQGLHVVPLAAQLPAGVYTVVLETLQERTTTHIVIVK